MSRPYRMNLNTVEITPLNRTSGNIDPEYRQFAGKKIGTPYNIKAQVNYFKTNERSPSLTGDEEQGLGRVVARKTDIEDLVVAPVKGDLITKIADEVVRFKIIEKSVRAHLDGLGHTIHYSFEEDKYKSDSV